MAAESEKLKIAIIGAGFSGTALAANILRQQHQEMTIQLIDKRGIFGLGEAYSTPYLYHLLNVRAHDMSAFEDDPDHFIKWLNSISYPAQHLDQDLPISQRFVPRKLYGQYLQSLLQQMGKTINLIANEVIDIVPDAKRLTLKMRDGNEVQAEKVVLALGNGGPGNFPFPVVNTNCINAWDFTAPSQIPKDDPVLIIGTGLSMIDVVLTLHQHEHRGKIYALSRHGLVPLPHTNQHLPSIDLQTITLRTLPAMTRDVRALVNSVVTDGGDWRSVIQALRSRASEFWLQASERDRKQFLRHILPYWNVHRHRVHHKLAALLADMAQANQLEVISGRVLRVEDGCADIKLRHSEAVTQLQTRWLINCTGPTQILAKNQPIVAALQQRGLATLDSLKLGFAVTKNGNMIDAKGQSSPFLYALGPPTKGMTWETTAVPDIRKQCLAIAKHII